MPVPRISVIIPVFNRAIVLSRAIDSVLSQDLQDFELIVVDDKSSDGSAQVALGYDDPRIQVVRLDARSGSNAARNVGIRAATAELIAFLDSDDAYLPHKLSTVVEEFGRSPDLEVLVDSFVKVSPSRHRERRNPRIVSRAEFRKRLFRRELWKSTSAITVRREAAFRAGLFDERISRRQDMDFLIRLSEFANCAATDATLWIKHWSADGISADSSFVPTTLALVARYPHYVRERLYRIGLCRDLARHLLLLLRQRQLARLKQEALLIVGQFGRRRTAQLLAAGTGELARRAIRRRRVLSGAAAAEKSRAVRNRASARS
jgi:glycosyltransferase involved in cell wall biosynthesis